MPKLKLSRQGKEKERRKEIENEMDEWEARCQR